MRAKLSILFLGMAIGFAALTVLGGSIAFLAF
jgi:hypothetical protein